MTQLGKRIRDSQATISQVMLPTDASTHGNVHGGVIMKLVDDAGAIVATRHSRSIVVTVAVDSMTFLSPVYVGNLVTLTAALSYVGRSSMEVECLWRLRIPSRATRPTPILPTWCTWPSTTADSRARCFL